MVFKDIVIAWPAAVGMAPNELKVVGGDGPVVSGGRGHRQIGVEWWWWSGVVPPPGVVKSTKLNVRVAPTHP